MFTSIKNIWQLLGVTLALVALYLVLDNARGFSSGVGALAGGWAKILKTLQARA